MPKLTIPVGIPGCLSGGTELKVNRGGNTRTMTLAGLVSRIDGSYKQASGNKWRHDIISRTQTSIDGDIRLGDIKSVWYSGEKQTYELTVSSGRSIRATADHPFLSDGDWIALDDLQVGDQVGMNVGRLATGTTKKQYQSTTTKYHPNQRKAANGLFRHWIHRITMEAHLNSLDYEEFLDILRWEKDTAATMTYLSSDQIVHHKDGNHRNNDISNLELLTDAEHRAEHADENITNVMEKLGYEKIISKKYFGTESVYDLEMAEDPHHFIANGFAVHNCGKSFLAEQMVASRLLDADGIVSSDRLRKVLTGDESCMTVHMEAFGIAHQIAKTRLKYGQDVFFDATNLLLKDLKQVVSLAPVGTDVEIVISDTPDSVSLERNNRRERTVPEAAMQKFIARQKSFDLALFQASYPDIEITLLSDKIEEVSDIQFDQLFPPDELGPLPEPLRSVLAPAEPTDAPTPPESTTEA